MSEQRVIELQEWQKAKRVTLSSQKAKRVTLSSDEAKALRALEHRLDVGWIDVDEATVSGKAGYVGIASLSEETQIVVRPHIPIASVLELACYAYELEPPEKSQIEDARLDDTGPADWLAFLLTLQVEKLLSIGLRQGYREVEEEIPYVRGRIDFGAVRWGESKPGLVPCRFEDFIVDTLENRILRGTLELLSAFARVRLVQPSSLMFYRIALTRMTSYYEPALTLCQLILESAGIEMDAGDVTTPGFFFKMSDVFEKVIERTLREEFGRASVHHQPSYSDRIQVAEGAPAIPVTFIPDNVIGPRDAPWLIVDAKYKNPLIEHHGDRFRNTDLYQAFTYAATLNAPAVLIYPRVDRDVDVTLELLSEKVRMLTVDLTEFSKLVDKLGFLIVEVQDAIL
jgi:5-methylcytosine-specific restriction enzyme subunit McrC